MTTANASGGIVAVLLRGWRLSWRSTHYRDGSGSSFVYTRRGPHAHEGGRFRHRFLAALASTIRPLPGVLPRGPAGCRDVPRFTGG